MHRLSRSVLSQPGPLNTSADSRLLVSAMDHDELAQAQGRARDNVVPAESTSPRGLRRRFRRSADAMPPQILAAILIDTIGAGAFYPLTLIYLRLTTHYSLAIIGLLLTTGALLGLPLGPFSGMLVDRFTARRILVLNNLISIVGYLLLLAIGSPVQLFIAVLLTAFSERLYWAAWPVFVAERVAGRRLEAWYATVNVVRSASLGIGAAAAAGALALGGTGILRAVLVFNIATSMAAAVLIARTRAQQRPERQDSTKPSWWLVLRDRPFLILTAANAALAFAWLLPALVLPIYIVQTLRLPGWLASVAFMVNVAVTTLLQRWLVGKFERLHRTRSIALGALTVLLCILLEALSNGAAPWLSATLVLTGVTLLSLGESLILPSVNAVVMTLAPESLRGRYSSLLGMSWTVSSIAGPVLVGSLLQWNVSLLWVVFAGLVSLGGAGFLLAERYLPVRALRSRETGSP